MATVMQHSGRAPAPAARATGLNGGDLDNDLLAALDEMLSFAGGSDDQSIDTGCHLADAFGDPNTMLGLGDISPLPLHAEQEDATQQVSVETETASPTSSPLTTSAEAKTSAPPRTRSPSRDVASARKTSWTTCACR